ncbi:hypothetical protein M8C13_04400 [Crossiella sp. SN42]|uniref:hypothetical protein n=1 Tax=Crossiella sp. SN42 TaxID=2944808 RepID=UPI00207D1EDB|nr:hypothetical protein [Crossiella sp. SN42]MCO1574999.1 hypothetical protein [Crossiella sp. SN42]
MSETGGPSTGRAPAPSPAPHQLGEPLNIVTCRTCPACDFPGAMYVHTDYRVYRPCGHAYRLPPLPTRRLSR